MNIRYAGIASFALLAITPAAIAEPAPGNSVEVVIEGLRNSKGNVSVELCTKDTYLKVCALAGRVPAKAGSVSIVIPNVPPGRYAMQSSHDENDNKKMDRNMIGIPKEGFAFSHNVKVCMGPPKFDQVAFDYAGGPKRIVAKLAYKLC